MIHRKRNEILILILCLLIGFALRFYTFDQKSLWIDEIYTFNDSRDDLKGQLKYYKENPTFLHPPLFFILTHLFYPFERPERDLRILPLIFGTLSIPMFHLLARQFSAGIALPCAISLTFMTYHISLSQDGRSYSLLMFLGLAGLYFFMKHLQTWKKRDLFLSAFFLGVSFYTSYSSIPFLVFSQILWFYQAGDENKRPSLSSFLIFNGLLFLICLPWILFVVLNYKGQPLMDPHHTEDPGSLWSITYWILNDWVPHAPLMIVSSILLILLPFFSKSKKNAILLLTAFVFPILGLYLFCKFLNITHYFTSRYFINLFPLFLVAIYLSLNAIEFRLYRLKRWMRLKFIFIVLFIFSNLLILPLYYHSQKQDHRGLVLFLKSHLRPGDKIFDGDRILTPGTLHYFGVYPKGRHYMVNFREVSGNIIEYKIPFTHQNKSFTIYYSNTCCTQYISDGSRLWIAVGKESAKKD